MERFTFPASLTLSRSEALDLLAMTEEAIARLDGQFDDWTSDEAEMAVRWAEARAGLLRKLLP